MKVVGDSRSIVTEIFCPRETKIFLQSLQNLFLQTSCFADVVWILFPTRNYNNAKAIQ